jgi:hypothetical protein
MRLVNYGHASSALALLGRAVRCASDNERASVGHYVEKRCVMLRDSEGSFLQRLCFFSKFGVTMVDYFAMLVCE